MFNFQTLLSIQSHLPFLSERIYFFPWLEFLILALIWWKINLFINYNFNIHLSLIKFKIKGVKTSPNWILFVALFLKWLIKISYMILVKKLILFLWSSTCFRRCQLYLIFWWNSNLIYKLDFFIFWIIFNLYQLLFLLYLLDVN